MIDIDFKRHKNLQDLFYNKRLIDKSMKCKICGKGLKTFHTNHLKKCGCTKEEYINKYGFPNIYYEKDYLRNLVIRKIYDLYFSNTSKWLLLSGFTRHYSTIEFNNKDQKKISPYNIERHLEGKDTVGAFPINNRSKFLVIDIDSYRGIQYSKMVAWYIKHFLKKYFDEREIHCNFSGSKGFHITLFFSTFVDISKLHKIFSIILSKIGVENFKDIGLEMRPTLKGKDGKGIKIPFGVQFRNYDDYNNYCYMVDEKFAHIEHEIEYLMNIKKSDQKIIDKIIKEHFNNGINIYSDTYLNISLDKEYDENDIFNTLSDENQGYELIEKIYEQGLIEEGTRHYWSFLIALLFKKQDIRPEEAYDKLYDWSIEQIKSGMSKSNIIEIMRDLKNIIYNGVYNSRKDYHLPIPIKSKITFSKIELEDFIKLNNISKNTGKKMITYQKILFSLLIHGKRKADNKGVFFMTYEQMMNMTGVSSSTTIDKVITYLDENNHIKIISRNKFSKKKYIKEPNTFKLNDKYMKYCNHGFEICDKKDLCSNCFINMVLYFYGKDDIGEILNGRIKKDTKRNLNKILDKFECNIRSK